MKTAMTSERIKEIQATTAYDNSISVYKALLQVWNECEQSYASQPSMSADEYDLQKLYDWVVDENRNPAITAFTSSTARNIASEFEFRLWRKEKISMSAEQWERLFNNEFDCYADAELVVQAMTKAKFIEVVTELSTAPSVKAEGWVRFEDEKPDAGQLILIAWESEGIEPEKRKLTENDLMQNWDGIKWKPIPKWY